MKTIASTLAAAALLAMTWSPASASHLEEQFTCDRGLFGGCLTTYVGPRDAASALRYAEDAKNALDRLLERNPRLASAHYNPRTGLVVLEQAPGQNAGNNEIGDAIAIFRTYRLRIENVTLMTPGMRFSRNGRKVIGDNGGSSRFSALRSIRFDMDTAPTSDEAIEQARRAFAPVTRSVFGDITWTRH